MAEAVFDNMLNSEAKSLQNIFCSNYFFEMASFQRPYAWEEEQTVNLFDDLYDTWENGPDTPYFLGSIVLIRDLKNPSKYFVVDGQQRLTTLSILFSVIHFKLNKYRDANYLQYVKQPADASKGLAEGQRLKLREKDNDFFKKYIVDGQVKELFDENQDQDGNKTEAQKHIKYNCRRLALEIDGKFPSTPSKGFTKKSERDNLLSFAQFIVSKCFLIVVTSFDSESAFRIFSVLNNRGLDLQASDLIKAEVLGAFSPEDQEYYASLWENIEEKISRKKINQILGHIRSIYSSLIKNTSGHTSLVKDISELIRHKKLKWTSEIFIKDILEPYCRLYRELTRQEVYVVPNKPEQAKEINHMLDWLACIDNEDWIPPVLKFMIDSTGSCEDLLEFLKKIERLAAYMLLCKKGTKARASRYGQILSVMVQKNGKYSLKDLPVELTDEEKQDFKKELEGDIYTMLAIRRKYIMMRIDSFYSDKLFQPDKVTIEHIFPQTVKKNSDWKNWEYEDRNRWLHKLGNLILLSRRKNTEASNNSFREKIASYRGSKKNDEKSSSAMTQDFLNEYGQCEEWTVEKVQERQLAMIEKCCKGWDL